MIEYEKGVVKPVIGILNSLPVIFWNVVIGSLKGVVIDKETAKLKKPE